MNGVPWKQMEKQLLKVQQVMSGTKLELMVSLLQESLMVKVIQLVELIILQVKDMQACFERRQQLQPLRISNLQTVILNVPLHQEMRILEP